MGCTVSLANRISTGKPADVADLLISTVNLAYHRNLMGAAGSLAVQNALNAESSGSFILAVEGGIPTAFGGRCCYLWNENNRDVTAMEVVKRLAPKALAVLSIGTCASFGGISGASPNPTGIQSVQTVTGASTINIPGCPSHPDWIVGTVARLLASAPLPLDSSRRPTEFFGSTIHNACPRRSQPWATTFGQEGLCLRDRGCKGQIPGATAPVASGMAPPTGALARTPSATAAPREGFRIDSLPSSLLQGQLQAITRPPRGPVRPAIAVPS
jgi:hydrogenase small subunit